MIAITANPVLEIALIIRHDFSKQILLIESDGKYELPSAPLKHKQNFADAASDIADQYGAAIARLRLVATHPLNLVGPGKQPTHQVVLVMTAASEGSSTTRPMQWMNVSDLRRYRLGPILGQLYGREIDFMSA